MALRSTGILRMKPGTPSVPDFCFSGKGGRPLPGIILMASLLTTLPAWSQYPGQVTKTAKDSPEMRAIAVLEFTGEPGKPTRSRLVPVAVLDAGQLQDGAIYLARPEPLALTGEVEYDRGDPPPPFPADTDAPRVART